MFGLVDDDNLVEALVKLRRMRAVAVHFAEASGWVNDAKDNIGLFFHVYGHNSVNSLHLHILDLDFTGPTYEALQYKNLTIDDVISVLEEEQRSRRIDQHASISQAF